MSKRAILVVSFGTTHRETKRKTLDYIADMIRQAFPRDLVYEAITSSKVKEVLKKKEQLIVFSVGEAMEQMRNDGMEEVFVQPTYMMDGQEYKKMQLQLAPYKEQFRQILVGTPLLTKEKEYVYFTKCLMKEMPLRKEKEAIVFMGHGTECGRQETYLKIRELLCASGYDHAYVGAVKSYPYIEDIITQMQREHYKRVYLTPLMLVAGAHVKADMLGENANAWRNCLEKAGYEVIPIVRGLGEYDFVSKLFIEKIKEQRKESLQMQCLAISHKTAPAGVRELFAFYEEEKRAFLHELLEKEQVKECVILSTCNRSELYFTGEKQAVSYVQQALARFKKISLEEWMKYFQIYQEDRAIRHLYKVACGMDSMVLGEDEILGQLKEAFFLAREEGATGYYFNTLFQDAITCAKRIKTETNLSKIPVSVGTLVANEVMQFEKEENQGKRVVIIGISGKMGSIIMKNISQKPGIQVYGTVRKHKVGIQILEPGVIPIDYEERYQKMDEADIVISVTSSPHYTITKAELMKVLCTKKKRLFLDLSVPMDIDKEVASIPDTMLHDIDYFERLSRENNSMKLQEVHTAEAIAEAFIDEVKKTIVFHDFLEEIPRLKAIFAERSFESILYELRDQSESKDLEIILNALKRL